MSTDLHVLCGPQGEGSHCLACGDLGALGGTKYEVVNKSEMFHHIIARIHVLTFHGDWPAKIVWISGVRFFATADGYMIGHPAIGIYPTILHTRINTVVVRAAQIMRTVRVQNTTKPIRQLCQSNDLPIQSFNPIMKTLKLTHHICCL